MIIKFLNSFFVKETDPNPFVIIYFLYYFIMNIKSIFTKNEFTKNDLFPLAINFSNLYLSFTLKNWIFIGSFFQMIPMIPMIYKFLRVITDIFLYKILREENIREMLRELPITQNHEDFLINMIMILCSNEMKTTPDNVPISKSKDS